MNNVTLVGKVDFVKIQDKGSWVSCSIKMSNDHGLDCWLEIRGVLKAGKEMEWLPRLKDHWVFVDGRFTSYEKKDGGGTVYQVSASKGDLHRLPADNVQTLIDMAGGISKVSGKVVDSKATGEGVHFLKLGVRYMKLKDNEMGYYYVRIKCPEGFRPEKYSEGSYATAFGKFEQGPDGKPTLAATFVG